MMSPSVLYFHGFASSPASAKITALRPLLEPDGITLNTPDLNIPSFEQLDFDAIVAHATGIARDDPPRAMVGSSMGALIALAVPLDVPRVLIAPALGIAWRWKDYIPDGDPVLLFNYARNEKAPIHRAFFEQIANVHVDDEPPRSRVTVLMGRKDESVPFAIVAETWERWQQSGKLAPGSKFIELEEGDHGLVSHADAIREAIVEATS
ncbi:MAG TPA: YqiA/YcfP family alpha/beta fold hydrolase [Thermoanaerobaculia bacterium]|nr:YqiA/YcfP family alpha/beta fold hydrolase [Thermoanaerobaculia bacterium]